MGSAHTIDAEELQNLGINFRTDEEMCLFAEVIREHLEVRVGQEITSRMSQKQINEFDNGVMSPRETAEWLETNCPEYKEICKKVRNEIKDELLKYKNDILGISQTVFTQWNGRSIDELEDISRGDYLTLKDNGIRTFGEIYSMDIEALAEILGENRKKHAVGIKSHIDELYKDHFMIESSCFEDECLDDFLDDEEDIILPDFIRKLK